MLTLGYLSKFPAKFKERENSIKDIVFNNISTSIDENGVINIKASTSKYTQEIEVYNSKNIYLKSECKVFCSCESFKYEFANSIFKSGSLLKPISFIRSIIKRPKERNEFNIPSGCKHIVALTRIILKTKIDMKKENNP